MNYSLIHAWLSAHIFYLKKNVDFVISYGQYFVHKNFCLVKFSRWKFLTRKFLCRGSAWMLKVGNFEKANENFPFWKFLLFVFAQRWFPYKFLRIWIYATFNMHENLFLYMYNLSLNWEVSFDMISWYVVCYSNNIDKKYEIVFSGFFKCSPIIDSSRLDPFRFLMFVPASLHPFLSYLFWKSLILVSLHYWRKSS